MAKPTHTLVIMDGELKVIPTVLVPFEVKGTSEFKANQMLKELQNA